MNCNFPELLAHDLDASNSVFATKKMSAGAPSVFSMNALQDLLPVEGSDLHLIDESVSVCLDEEGYTAAPSPDIRCCPLPRQPTPLEPIDEGPIEGVTLDSTAIAYHAESDWDSLSTSSQPSSTMEIPSARPRDASVITSATSMVSGSLSAGFANKDVVAKSVPDMSWIDVESDSEEPPSTDSPCAAPAPPLRRRLQFSAEPNTIPNLETGTCPDTQDRERGSAIPAQGPPLPKGENYTLHSGRVSKHWPSRRQGMIRIISDQSFPPGFPHTLPGDEVPQIPPPTRPGSPPCSSPTLASRQLKVARNSPVVIDEVIESQAISPPLPTPIRSVSCPEDDQAPERLPTKHSTDTHWEHLCSPRAAIPSNIQTWIESSRDATMKPDDQLPGIPLPPDVVDNLRISITCFPDTMLLTSSLSVETIRSYSRKVKACPSDLKRDSSPPSPYSPKKWGFGRILSRRSNASLCDRVSRNSTEEAPVVPWTPLRAVFASGSEYLCDALYAHIVAYNYVSTLQRCASASPPKTSQRATDEGEVPRKAAALLGLRESDASSIETTRSPVGTSRYGSTSEKRDGALRDLLVGLSRCITRLVTTLREGGSEVVGEESGDVDLFLVRALCEVVRSSEER